MITNPITDAEHAGRIAALFVSRQEPVILLTTAGWDVERAHAEARMTCA